MNKEQQIKNLRLCLRIHLWASALIVLLWAFIQTYFYLQTASRTGSGRVFVDCATASDGWTQAADKTDMRAKGLRDQSEKAGGSFVVSTSTEDPDQISFK